MELGVEFTTDDGIYLKGQAWKYAGCDFYFPGAYEKLDVCPAMTRPVCYVYNGAICCASECPGINYMLMFSCYLSVRVVHKLKCVIYFNFISSDLIQSKAAFECMAFI